MYRVRGRLKSGLNPAYPLKEVRLLDGEFRDLKREMGVEHVMGDSDGSFHDYESGAFLGSTQS